MFAKLSVLTLVALPLVSALTLNPLTDATVGGSVTITWTASTSDPQYFSILMVNPTNFHNTFAIANNVQTSLGELDVTLPEMPVGSGYSLEAIAISDVNTVYSQSSEFSVGATASTTSTTTETATDTSSTTSTTGVISVTTVSTTSTTTTTRSSSSSTSASTSKTSATSSATTSSKSGGATPLRLGGVAPAAALLLSAVAGAAMIF